MHNDKNFHVLEREEYRQRRGIEVDLMQVSCKLQNLLAFGKHNQAFVSTCRNLNTNRLHSIRTCVLQKEKVIFQIFSEARRGHRVIKN